MHTPSLKRLLLTKRVPLFIVFASFLGLLSLNFIHPPTPSPDETLASEPSSQQSSGRLIDLFGTRIFSPSWLPAASDDDGDGARGDDRSSGSSSKKAPVRFDNALQNAIFPVDETRPDTDNDSWRDANNRQIRDLLRCIGADDCGPNQHKVVILGSPHFKNERQGFNNGEAIWARSSARAIRKLGYTTLISHTMPLTLQLYQMFPDLVVSVWLESYVVYECYKDRGACLKSSWNPHGIPLWKLFSFYFWREPNHPLGRKWVLSPENYTAEYGDAGRPMNTYIGYSVEESCLSHAYVEHKDRFITEVSATNGVEGSQRGEGIPLPPAPAPAPAAAGTTQTETRTPRAYVLAKLMSYFGERGDRA